MPKPIAIRLSLIHLLGGIMMSLQLSGGIATAANLPLNQVVLFTSGVAYFERAGEIEPHHSMTLALSTQQIQDWIKSLVVIDEGGGAVGSVNYESREPAARTLASFRLNLADNPSLLDILNRLRGITVRLQVGGRQVQGEIVGVESRFRPVDTLVLEEQVLKIYRDGALQSFALNDIQRFEFPGEEVQKHFAAALAVLAGSSNQDNKAVTIKFVGENRRMVRVGYILEAPVWKMSYRLVLSEPAPFLQGWAHIENITDEDWQDVTMSLVSGQPLTFIQNLYDPIYRRRPLIASDDQPLVSPPRYDGELTGSDDRREMMMMKAPAMAPAARGTETLRASVTALADGADPPGQSRVTGELFEHTLAVPVNLPRRQGAMLPIINTAVAAEPVSIFNPAVNTRHPVNGVDLQNTAPLFLRAGPVTVFEDGMYAGDARLGDLPQQEHTLLAYALDLNSEVSQISAARPEEIVAIRISGGALFMSRRFLDTTTYTIRNKRKTARAMIVEHPRRPDWTLLEPAGEIARTHDLYRIKLEIPSQHTHTLTVHEERRDVQRLVLSSLNWEHIELFLQQPHISDDMRQALKTLTDMQQVRSELQARLRRHEQELNTIVSEQGRLRDNMRVVAPNSESYFMWERQLVAQEKIIQDTRTELSRLTRQFEEQQHKITVFLQALELE